MKEELIGKKFKEGFATLEILIAFTILILCISGAILLASGGGQFGTGVDMVSFGNQSVAVDSQTNNEAIFQTQKILEDTRAKSRENFSSVVSATIPSTIPYAQVLSITDLTACKKQATSTTTWTDSGRPQKIEFSTFLSDIPGALALGGDCITDPPGTNWDSPARFASDTFSPGKPTTMDVLDRIAYLGMDKVPFLNIADTHGAVLGQNSGLFVTFTNGFDLGATPNAIDVIKFIDPLGAVKNYAFLAMSTNTDQLKVVDVTDITKPVLKATVPLSSCVTGSAPQGWRLYAYKDRLYFLTRYTAGPELHVFNISDPTSPSEIGAGACRGFELGDTSESIEVRDQNIGGSTIRFLYLATDEIDKELRVFNVTNPLSITEVSSANQDLPGAQDGQSLYISGNKLYFGRQSSSGPDLYIFDIKDPTVGLTILGSQDIGTSVLAIKVAGQFAFLGTSKVNKEFQIWNIFTPGSISLVKDYNFGNVVDQGIDYEPDYVYATGQSTPNFQILYDSTP